MTKIIFIFSGQERERASPRLFPAQVRVHQGLGPGPQAIRPKEVSGIHLQCSQGIEKVFT